MSGDTVRTEAARTLLRESTENFLTSLGQALRACQFYGTDKPGALRAMASARNACKAIWEQQSEIELLIQETTILLGEDVVYDNEEHGQSLAFLMHKDGLRVLRILEGFETEDLESFLVLLHKAKHLRTEEDDLITLLWAADFSRVFYSYIELGDVEEPKLDMPENPASAFTRALAAGSLEMTSQDQPDSEPGTATHEGSADPPALPDDTHEGPQDVQALLANDEIDYLRQELARERSRDVVHDVVTALLDRLEDSDARTQSEILMILSDFIPALVLQRRLELAASTLSALRQLADSPTMSSDTQKDELQHALDSVGRSAAIEGVLQALEAGDLVTDDDVLREVLASLGPENLDIVIRAREKASRNGLRVTLDAVLEDAWKRLPDAFLALCRSQDAIVACGAVRIVGHASRQAVETHLVKLMKQRNPKIRAAVVEVMVIHGGDSLLRALVDSLADDNREVRCAAAWGLGTWQYSRAFATLEAILDAKDFRDASVTEMRAMFSAFARVGQEKALATLARILNRKSLFGGREATEMRVAAARALGAIQSPGATEELKKSQNDKNGHVRRAVMRSLMAGRK